MCAPAEHVPEPFAAPERKADGIACFKASPKWYDHSLQVILAVAKLLTGRSLPITTSAGAGRQSQPALSFSAVQIPSWPGTLPGERVCTSVASASASAVPTLDSHELITLSTTSALRAAMLCCCFPSVWTGVVESISLTRSPQKRILARGLNLEMLMQAASCGCVPQHDKPATCWACETLDRRDRDSAQFSAVPVGNSCNSGLLHFTYGSRDAERRYRHCKRAGTPTTRLKRFACKRQSAYCVLTQSRQVRRTIQGKFRQACCAQVLKQWSHVCMSHFQNARVKVRGLLLILCVKPSSKCV